MDGCAKIELDSFRPFPMYPSFYKNYLLYWFGSFGEFFSSNADEKLVAALCTQTAGFSAQRRYPILADKKRFSLVILSR